MDEAWPERCFECGRHLDKERPTGPCPGCCIWLDGQKVGDWIRRFMELRDIPVTDTIARRLYAWRMEGDSTKVEVVDKIACELGFHLSDLPLDVWLPRRARAGRHYAPEIKHEVIRRLNLGEPLGRLAEETGVCKTSIQKWQKRAA